MAFTRPPKHPVEMRALQQKYGQDADIAAALGVSKHTVERYQKRYGLPVVTRISRRSGKNISEEVITEMFAGRRFR